MDHHTAFIVFPQEVETSALCSGIHAANFTSRIIFRWEPVMARSRRFAVHSRFEAESYQLVPLATSWLELQLTIDHLGHRFDVALLGNGCSLFLPNDGHDLAVDLHQLLLPSRSRTFQNGLSLFSVAANEPFDMQCDCWWQCCHFVLRHFDAPIPPAGNSQVM